MEKVELEYYQSEYLSTFCSDSNNGDIPDSKFSLYEKKARRYLSSFTFNRIESLKFTDTIRDCICEMAEFIYRNELKNKYNPAGITSESTDGHSVSYEKEKTQIEINRDLYNIAVRYLRNTGLLYAGVMTVC